MTVTVYDINGDKTEINNETIANILDNLYMEYPDASCAIESFLEWVREDCGEYDEDEDEDEDEEDTEE